MSFGPRSLGPLRAGRWVVVCYHAVPPESAEQFRRQLEWFKRHFRLVTLEEGVRCLQHGCLESEPVLTITFDDGHWSLTEVALPILLELKVQAFAYVVADYVRRGIIYRDRCSGRAVSISDLQTWVRCGQGVGSHTATHAPLPLCTPERLDWELRASKAMLEDWTGTRVEHFSYPWGQHNDLTREKIEAQGLYKSAATIDRGSMLHSHDPYRLRRAVLDPWMPLWKVNALLIGADYVYWLRHLRPRPKGYWETEAGKKMKWDMTDPEVQSAELGRRFTSGASG